MTQEKYPKKDKLIRAMKDMTALAEVSQHSLNMTHDEYYKYCMKELVKICKEEDRSEQ